MKVGIEIFKPKNNSLKSEIFSGQDFEMPLRIWGKAPSLSFFEAGKVVCLRQSIHNFKTPDAKTPC